MGCGTSKESSSQRNAVAQSTSTPSSPQQGGAHAGSDDSPTSSTVIKFDPSAEQGQQPDVQEADRLLAAGQYQGALALYRVSLKDMQDRSTRPPAGQRLDSVPLLSKQAACLSGMNDFARAVPLLHSAIETRTSLLGASHPDTLASVREMAASLEEMQCFEAAVPLRRRVYCAVQAGGGGQHDAEALAAAAQLGTCQMKAGAADEALPLLRSTYQGRSELLGPEHPATLEVLRTLTACLQRLDEHSEAIPLLRQLLSCLLASPEAGPEHRDTLQVMDNLAHSLHHTGEHGQAKPMFSKSLNGRRSSLGHNHPDTIQSTQRLAALLRHENDLEAALPLYCEVLSAVRVTAFPIADAEGRTMSTGGGASGRMAVATAAAAVGACLGGLGRWAEAEPMYAEAVQITEACCGGTEAADPAALRMTAGLAEAVEAQAGREAAALALWGRAAEGLRAVLGARHPDTLRCQARAALLALRLPQPAQEPCSPSAQQLASPRQARGFIERGKSSLRLPPLDPAFSPSHLTAVTSAHFSGTASPQSPTSPSPPAAPPLPRLGSSSRAAHAAACETSQLRPGTGAGPPQEDEQLSSLLLSLGKSVQAGPAAAAAAAAVAPVACDGDGGGEKLSVLLQRLRVSSGSFTTGPGSPREVSALAARQGEAGQVAAVQVQAGS